MKIYLVLLFSWLLCSCNNTDSFIENLNQAPELYFQLSDPYEETTMKLVKQQYDSLKLNQAYLFTLLAKDVNDNIKQVKLKEVTFATGFLLDENQVVHEELFLPTNTEKSFYYRAFEPGSHTIAVEVLDDFAQSSSVTLQLEVFENLPPQAFFTASKEQAFLYKLDAQMSKDLDGRYGGYIKKYIFQIEAERVEAFTPVVYYKFNRTGPIRVSLWVVDDQGVSSEAFTKIIIIDA